MLCNKYSYIEKEEVQTLNDLSNALVGHRKYKFNDMSKKYLVVDIKELLVNTIFNLWFCMFCKIRCNTLL